MITKTQIVFFLFAFVWASISIAQTVPIIDSLNTAIDTVGLPVDTLPMEGDTIAPVISNPSNEQASSTLQPDDQIPSAIPDSLRSGRPSFNRPPRTANLAAVKLSPDSLDSPVEYDSSDSMRNEITGQKIYLYGNATVKYTTMNITADQIILDWASNTVTAQAGIDSLGKPFGVPKFSDGSEEFTAHKIRYNFKTRKGIIYDLSAKQGSDMYVLSSKAKLFSPADTIEGDNVVYSADAIFTTCNHPEPHFGIRSKKQKVVTDKLVVVGPSNLEIAGIPSPIWLPFGFFPLSKGKKTGLIFPRDYEFSPTWGFGFRDIGYFFPLGDNMNLTVTGDIYTRGTWAIKAASQYKKRYKYSGNLTIGYSNRKDQDNVGLPLINRSWSFKWSHRQAATAHPTNTFSVSANIQTNNFQSFNQNDAGSVLTNTLSSNLSFTKKFPGTPFRLSLSASHSQNTRTRIMNISLPIANLQMDRIYPFKSKAGGKNEEKWYEKISLQYKMEAQNRFSATDTTLFSSETLDNAQYGVRHTVNSNASFRLFKFFNFSPSVNYRENWYFNSLSKDFDPTPVVDTTRVYNADSTEYTETYDTVSYGTVNDIREAGFKPLRLFDVSMSFNTQIYGTRVFSKGFIRGIRHVIKPSISFNFTPDYTNPKWGYFDYVQTDTREDFDDLELYSVFEGGIYDRPTSQGKVMGLSYSLNNIFEAKYFSKRDSTTKKLKLFDNIYLGGSYNFVADSLKWSPVRARGAARFFKGITNVRFSATFDPYDAVVTSTGSNRRINTLYWDSNKKFLRFDRADLGITTNLTIGQIRDFFKKGNDGGESSAAGLSSNPDRRSRNRREDVPTVGEAESLLDVLANFRISHNFTLQLTRIDGKDTTFVQAHSLRFSGRIKLTDKWNINVGNVSYDFKSDRLVYPDLGFSRDLHCWEMGMNWRPARGTYSFFIRVKPGTLDFINVPYKKNNADGFRGF